MRLSEPAARDLVHAIAFSRPAAVGLERVSLKAAAGAVSVATTHARWWNSRNVVGLCYAAKVRHGRLTDLSLQVLVRAKRPRSKVPTHERVPDSIGLEAVGLRGKLPTDVREVGMPRLDVLVSDRRPTRPGFNISHRSGGSGTLGCAVRSVDTGERLALSCAHVIARHGRAKPGDRVLVPSLEQARANRLLGTAPFGKLMAVGPISYDFERAATNVDAATVLPHPATGLDNQLAVLDVRPSRVRADAPIGLPVRKVGFATELTFGTILAQHMVLGIPFVDELGRTRNVWFTELMGISHFAQPGDSGALVLDLQGEAVGLHMASAGGMSISAPIQRVLDSLRCTLDVSAPPVA
ncbi:MAG TPA: hypothetical protein VF815_29185 [Myxococcaceae bacterium]